MNYDFSMSGEIIHIVSNTEVMLDFHDFQLLRWAKTPEIPRKTYWTKQPQKVSKHTIAPTNRFNRPFRKHLFRVGKSKK